MPVVRAALEDFIGYRTTSTAEFRARGVGQNCDFSDSLMINGLHCLTRDLRIIVVLAVDQEIVGAWTRAIYREAHTIGQVVSKRNALDPRFGEQQLYRISSQAVGEVLDFGVADIAA